MKSLLVTLAAAGALAFAPVAFAADAPAAGNNIVVVNIQQIMAESAAAKSVREQLEAKQKVFQEEVNKREESLQKEDQELSKQRATLSKEAFADKSTAFRKKVTEGQKEAQSKKAMLDSGFEHAVADIQKVVTQIINDMSKEKSFSMAIPSSQLLYADTKLDITAEVLKRLNDKLPKVDVKFDAPDKK